MLVMRNQMWTPFFMSPKSIREKSFLMATMQSLALTIRFTYTYYCWQASLVAQPVKNMPAMWETWVWSLGREDPLEEGMAAHSSIPSWRIPQTEEPGGLQSMGSQRVRHDCMTKHSTACIKKWKAFLLNF